MARISQKKKNLLKGMLLNPPVPETDPMQYIMNFDANSALEKSNSGNQQSPNEGKASQAISSKKKESEATKKATESKAAKNKKSK